MLIAPYLERLAAMFPDHELLVLAEFAPPRGTWIPYHPKWTLGQNLAKCRSDLCGRVIAFTAVVLEPGIPAWRLRLIALGFRPLYCLFFNENLDHFLLRPTCAAQIVRHLWWRTGNLIRAQVRAQAGWRKWARRLARPGFRRALWLYTRRRIRRVPTIGEPVPVPWPEPLPDGISVMGSPRPVATKLRLEFVDSIAKARYRWLAFAAAGVESLDPLAEPLQRDETLFGVHASAKGRSLRPHEPHAYVVDAASGVAVFDTRKAQALKGGEDALDLSFRAWLAGWPSVRVGVEADAPPDVSARARYQRLLDRLGIADAAGVFLSAVRERAGAIELLRTPAIRQLPADQKEAARGILALTSGHVAIFEGRPVTGKPRLLVAAPYSPFPLSHGGAVRMYNLTSRAARDFDLSLIVFVDRIEPPPAELRNVFCEIVQVVRTGSHARPLTSRPDTVEEFDSPAFHAALRTAVARWKPRIVQLEYTRMAMYAQDCGRAATILVEHDVKVDLYGKLLRERRDWEWEQQHARWKRFEEDAWQSVDAVVVMSSPDLATVGSRGVALANGVDIERFRPSGTEPDAARLLFIGSFGHLPNLLALEFFLSEVWPRLAALNPKLHIIAGQNPEAQLRHHASRVSVNLNQPGVELEGFVADVRPAYRRAAIVLAPLTASAGTNVKVLEAMAMGKAVVSTPAGVNGLDVVHGREVAVAAGGEAMASEIERLIRDPQARRQLESHARDAAVSRYDWDAIARQQAGLYRRLV